MADSQLKPRYVGYRRPGDTVLRSEVADLAVLERCHTAWITHVLGLAGSILLYLSGVQLNIPAFRFVGIAILLGTCVGVGACFLDMKSATRLERALGAIPLARALIIAGFFVLAPKYHFAPLLTVLYILADKPVSHFFSKQLEKAGFKTWKEVKAEIQRVQELEQQTYLPPVPENLYTGDPPRLT